MPLLSCGSPVPIAAMEAPLSCHSSRAAPPSLSLPWRPPCHAGLDPASPWVMYCTLAQKGPRIRMDIHILPFPPYGQSA